MEEPALIRRVADGRSSGDGAGAAGGYHWDRSRSPGRAAGSGSGLRGGRSGRLRGGKSGDPGVNGGGSGSKDKAKGLKVHRSAPGGKQICFKWNRADGGCEDPCPAGRAHMCERCLQPHRGHGCTRNPSGVVKGGKGSGKAHS